MLILFNALNLLFQIYSFMLVIRILGSWLPQLNAYRLMQFINYYTDPYLNLFRRFIPPLGMIDISPIFAFLCLNLIQKIVFYTLIYFLA